MSGEEVSSVFKRCRSAINVNDPTLVKIARELNVAEMLLLRYLKEVSTAAKTYTPAQKRAVDHLTQLIGQELFYLKKVKASEVVNITGGLVTFKSDDGEILVTVVPEEDLQKTFQPFFSFQNVKPRFAKPVASQHDLAMPSYSTESVYYDTSSDLPSEISTLPSGTSHLCSSIYGLLNYIFSSAIGKFEKTIS